MIETEQCFIWYDKLKDGPYLVIQMRNQFPWVTMYLKRAEAVELLIKLQEAIEEWEII